jgi:hypothetical protein
MKRLARIFGDDVVARAIRDPAHVQELLSQGRPATAFSTLAAIRLKQRDCLGSYFGYWD